MTAMATMTDMTTRVTDLLHHMARRAPIHAQYALRALALEGLHMVTTAGAVILVIARRRHRNDPEHVSDIPVLNAMHGLSLTLRKRVLAPLLKPSIIHFPPWDLVTPVTDAVRLPALSKRVWQGWISMAGLRLAHTLPRDGDPTCGHQFVVPRLAGAEEDTPRVLDDHLSPDQAGAQQCLRRVRHCTPAKGLTKTWIIPQVRWAICPHVPVQPVACDHPRGPVR